MREIYDWVPWFRSLAQRIAEGGPELLIDRAKKVEWKEDRSEAPLLSYGDENIDPFSFFYYLAGHNSAKRRARVFPASPSTSGYPIRNILSAATRSCFRRPALSRCCSITTAEGIRNCSGESLSAGHVWAPCRQGD